MIPIKVPKKGRGRPEDTICVQFVRYLEYKRLRYHHSPNEIQRGGIGGIIAGARNKRVGVSAGFLDYIIYISPEIDLYLEIKTGEGTLSKEQKEWIRFLREETKNYAEVAYSLKEAISIVEQYLKKQ
jgi:hypothetical protein